MTPFIRQQMGWPEGGYPATTGSNYCGVGNTNCYGRAIMDSHLKACLHAGINILGANSGKLPGQCEFHMGPGEGTDTGDHLWMARYILGRITEDFGVGLTFDPTFFKGDSKYLGCSTKLITGCISDNKYFDSLKTTEEFFIFQDDLLKSAESLNTDASSVDSEMEEMTAKVEKVTLKSLVSPHKLKIDYLKEKEGGSVIDPYVASSIAFSKGVLQGDGLESLLEHYESWKSEMDSQF